MYKPQIFSFEMHQIRTILINDEPYFVGKDVAEILGYKNGSRDINRHVDKEDRQNYQNGTFDSPRGLTVINESGLFSLILGSKLPTAKKFKRWVTSEVLPSIRKQGGYLTPDKIEEVLLNPDTLIQLAMNLKEERGKNQLLNQQIAEYEPKISYLDMILSSTDTVATSQIAADYGMSAIALNKLLNKLGVQHKISGQWILYRRHMNQGYTKSHTSEIPKSDGGVKVVMNTKWTQKGRIFIYEILKKEGHYPQMDLEDILQEG